jgi:hypothetical protein
MLAEFVLHKQVDADFKVCYTMEPPTFDMSVSLPARRFVDYLAMNDAP